MVAVQRSLPGSYCDAIRSIGLAEFSVKMSSAHGRTGLDHQPPLRRCFGVFPAAGLVVRQKTPEEDPQYGLDPATRN